MKNRIEEIIKELSIEIYNNDISSILGNPSSYPTELIEKISILTAKKYWLNEISYEDGDCIMNNVYNYWSTDEKHFSNYGFSEIAWDCFNAFDAGEYIHENDSEYIEPSEKYTRPLIKEFLIKNNLLEI